MAPVMELEFPQRSCFIILFASDTRSIEAAFASGCGLAVQDPNHESLRTRCNSDRLCGPSNCGGNDSSRAAGGPPEVRAFAA
eukprot:13899500-Alexandrium_andersonii.AAC.1